MLRVLILNSYTLTERPAEKQLRIRSCLDGLAEVGFRIGENLDIEIIDSNSLDIEECRPRLLISDDVWLAANSPALKLRTAPYVVSVDHLSYETYCGDEGVHLVNSHTIASINYSYSGDGHPKGR